jgi:myo-inositol-1(or 4)-monophosphatase
VNGVPLRVSGTPALGDALLVTGFPYDVHKRAPDLVELFGAFLGTARAVRRLGSAALDLCYIAAGRFDGFWEQHLKPWDVSAGALIAREAGGRVTGMDGTPFNPVSGHLLASNGVVHDSMLDVIRLHRERRGNAGTN